MSLSITHTAAEGTLLAGTVKGDGAWEAIKAAQARYYLRGWKYFRSIRMIGISHSRDRAPDLLIIDRTAEVLREAGFDVVIEVDATPRAMDKAEADRAERMDDRADALHAKADRKNAAANARHAAAQQIADGIPTGQPILVGHHSERRHRRDLARLDNHMRASIARGAEANRAEHGATAAEKHMQHREDPRQVMRRLDKLRADRRRVQRALDGYTRTFRDNRGDVFYVEDHRSAEGRNREQREAEAAQLDEQIRYWQEFLDAEIAAGRFTPIDLSTIKRGDQIGYWGGWSTVVRVNRKTVTVTATMHGREYGQHKVPVDEIRGHRLAQPGVQTVDLDAPEVTQ